MEHDGQPIATYARPGKTGTTGSSIRLYYEGSHVPPPIQPGQRIGVPAGFAIFRDDPVPLPRAYAEDLRAFFRPLRPPPRAP